jgi:hypothetical protein
MTKLGGWMVRGEYLVSGASAPPLSTWQCGVKGEGELRPPLFRGTMGNMS